MTSEQPATGAESVPTEHVVLAMSEGQDRDLLADWLGSLRYRVDTVGVDAALPREYDLCLLDRDGLAAFRAELLARNEASGSVFLPHALVVPASIVGNVRQQLDAEVDALLDDVIPVPMAKALLRRRIENLLRAHRSSVKLAERERQYRQLVELTPEGILLVDDGHIRYANAAAGSLFDVDDPADLEGRQVSPLVDPADRDAFDQLLAAVGESDEAADTEFVDLSMQSTTGRPLFVSVAGVPVVYGGRRTTQLLVRDQTTERQRKQRLTLFGRAIESAAQGITIADADQDDEPLVYANRGFQRITGYPLEEILGRNCRFLQGEHTDPETVDRIREAIETESPVSVDVLNYRYDGTPFWNRLDIVPVEDEHGDVTHFLGFQRDVTERKEREQQLAVLNRVLRHNLRNKMNVIQVYASKLEGVDGAAEAADAIQAAADDLLALSEQIRKFDSILAADERDLQPLDIAALVREAPTSPDESVDTGVERSVPSEARILGHETLRPALMDLLTLTDGLDGQGLAIDVTVEPSSVVMEIVGHSDAITQSDLEIIESGVETPLEHLQRIELWLLRWAVEESHGEFTVDVDADSPTIVMRFRRADERK